MKKLLGILHRFFLFCSLVFLLAGVAVAIVDAARSIGSSAVVLSPLKKLLTDLQGEAGQLIVEVQSQSLADAALEWFFNLPAVAVFILSALLIYLMAYLFKKT